MLTMINTPKGLSLTSILFVFDFTVTLALVIQDNKKSIKNKQIPITAKEVHKLAKKELRAHVKSNSLMSQKNIDEVKKITIDLYGENQEFDILEAFNISFLGLSELEHEDPNNRRVVILRRKVLKMITMFDPYLTFTDQQNEGWNKYEQVVRDTTNDWGKYLAYVRNINYDIPETAAPVAV